MIDLTRSFICIDFPPEVIKEVARIQEIIDKKNFTGKPIELENLHLTLKFLGHITPKTLNKVKEVLSNINFPKLNLKLSKVGTFNFKGKPRIAWVKVTGKVFDLQTQIDLVLKDLFKPEERFMSHLTIARIKYTKSPKSFIDYVSKIKPKQIPFQVNSFKLKSSDLTPQGPVYTTIKKYYLNKD